MKSIFSTQNLQTFFLRKYWRLPRRGPPGPPPGPPSRRGPPGPPCPPPGPCPPGRGPLGDDACLCSSAIAAYLSGNHSARKINSINLAEMVRSVLRPYKILPAFQPKTGTACRAPTVSSLELVRSMERVELAPRRRARGLPECGGDDERRGLR